MFYIKVTTFQLLVCLMMQKTCTKHLESGREGQNQKKKKKRKLEDPGGTQSFVWLAFQHIVPKM